MCSDGYFLVAVKFQAMLKKRWLHMDQLRILCEGLRGVQPLPLWVFWAVTIYKFLGRCQEIVFIELSGKPPIRIHMPRPPT